MNADIFSGIVITKVHSISTLYTQKNTKAQRKNRRCWAIVIKYEGETIYRSGGKNVVSDIRHIVVLPQGCSYDWECTESGHFSIIEFESSQTAPEPVSFPIKHGEKILKMFKELEYKHTLRGRMIEAESIRDTYSIILSVIAPCFDRYVPNSKRQRLQPAIEYISQNYNKNITNDTLASITGISTVYFRKLFTEVMGVAPITYVKQLRIDKAKEILKSDYGTLSDVAQSLGYSTLYDFSRDFKKHTGVSPSKYNRI